jgi:hypothetical protein
VPPEDERAIREAGRPLSCGASSPFPHEGKVLPAGKPSPAGPTDKGPSFPKIAVVPGGIDTGIVAEGKAGRAYFLT